MISDPWIDRSVVVTPMPPEPPRQYKASKAERARLREERRVKREELRVCINGPRVGFIGKHGIVHGPVVQGGRCQRCLDAKRGVEKQ